MTGIVELGIERKEQEMVGFAVVGVHLRAL